MRAFLGLGSNIGDRRAQLARAVAGLPDVVAVSRLYETEPVGGPPGQDLYLNLVVELDTELGPRRLLEVAQQLEGAAGRRRGVRWGPRTLDVDVLLVGDQVVGDVDLVVPHPRMWERRFVVEPLVELAPDLVSPEAREGAGGAVEVVGRLAGYRSDRLERPAPSVRGWSAERCLVTTVRLIGPGRAGRALAAVLADAGCDVTEVLTRHDDVAGAAVGTSS